MSAEWLKLETGKTVTTLRFLSTHLDLVEAERLKKRLYEEVGFLENRLRERKNNSHLENRVIMTAETAKVS